MSKVNALAGLIGNYGDSDDESDEGLQGVQVASNMSTADMIAQARMRQVHGIGSENYLINAGKSHSEPIASAAIHPAPIPHCRE